MSEEQQMVLVYIVCKDLDEAKSIGRHLLEKHLAACVNMFPIESAYWWEGAIVEDREAVLIAKTVANRCDALERHVLALHSYSVPCILRLPVSGVEKGYLGWLVGALQVPPVA